jgi:hypothetical protein
MPNELEQLGTSFATVYDSFFDRVSDDMYFELTELDTMPMLQGLLLNALPRFEFPKVDIFDYTEGVYMGLGTYKGVESNNVEVPAAGWVGGSFNVTLTQEEINIIAIYMVAEWLGQQLATTENTRLKYSGSDFKFTSQANHMAKIKVLKDNFIADGFHMQRLYKRRKRTEDGKIQSTLGQIMEVPSYGFKV